MKRSFIRSGLINRLPWFQPPTAGGEVSIDVSSELDQLREWINISSASNDPGGNERMQLEMQAKLSELGFSCQFLPHPKPQFAPFLRAEFQGLCDDFITLVCHTDTVMPSDGFRMSDDKTLAFGSGAIDDKGGLVVLISALRRFLRQDSKPKYSLRVLCSPNEEAGSTGFIPVYLECAKDTSFAIGMEPALSNGSIICQRRGNRWYDIDVTGREAHAGRSQGEHANAAHDLAKKITALQNLNSLKKGISVNIGHIEGGRGRHNIICGLVRAKLDVRFTTLEQRDWLHEKIQATLKTSHETSVCGRFSTTTAFQIVDDCPPVSPTSQAIRLSQSYTKSIRQLEGRSIRAEAAGGAGDVNYLSRAGVVVLDGFGPVGGEMHTRDEFVEIRTLATRSLALADFLRTVQLS